MSKKLTCIECPTGCTLTVDIDNGRVTKVTGHKCPKGEAYAKQEIESPTRILTSSVRAEGLSLKMIPVRTTHPIPKNKLKEAMREIRKLRIRSPVTAGQVLDPNFLNLNTPLIATRDASAGLLLGT